MLPISSTFNLSPSDQSRLYQGDIVLQSRLYSLWGGSVSAQIYLPVTASVVWRVLTQYDRWTVIFPPITQSILLDDRPLRKRLCQSAQKKFALITIQVDAELIVREYPHWRIAFTLATPNQSFREFEAEILLRETEKGTFLRYTVQAAATLPIPSLFIEEAMRHDLPENLKFLRAYLLALH